MNISLPRLAYFIITNMMSIYFFYHMWMTGAWYLLAPAILGYLFLQYTISVHYHMGVTHGALKFNYKAIDHFFTWVGISLANSSPIPWALIHRMHHKFIDTDRDPHSPQRHGFITSYAHLWKMPDFLTENQDVPKRDLIAKYRHLFVYNNIYILTAVFFAIWYGIYFLFGLEGVLVWAFACTMESHNLGVINAWVHKKGDKLIDNTPPWFLVLFMATPEGAYHDEHHAAPRKYTHTNSWLEWPARLTEFLHRMGIVTIHDYKVQQ